MSSEQARTDPTVPLIEQEQTIHPVNDADQEPALLPMQNGQHDVAVVSQTESVIWTPRFIMLFVVTLVAGLSLESLLTQGWAIRWFSGIWVFLGHLVLVAAGWIVLLRVSRSRWLRLGAVFGLIFVVFVTINVILQAILVQPSNYLLAHVNVVTFLALAGCSLCLTIDRLPVGRWDVWVLGLTPVLGVVLLVPIYIVRSDRSMAGWENSISLVALTLGTLIWWIRPTCWRNAPGPTLLFGSAPLLLLLIDIIYVTSNSYNFFPVYSTEYASATFDSRQTIFFFSQIVLLCLLLTIMRLVQAEKRK